MQNNPQQQDKHPRKHKVVDGKEETKLSTPDLISDISQLIPVPISSGTGSKATESTSAERGKLGSHESSKTCPATKSAGHLRRTHPAQTKTGAHGRTDEAKSGNPSIREKEATEDSSKNKEGTNKISRGKMESLNQEDNRQVTVSPKQDENLLKMKDEKTRISRVKVERSGGRSSPVSGDSSHLNYKDDHVNTLKGTRATTVENSPSPGHKIGHAQAELVKESEVNLEKAGEGNSSVISSCLKTRDEESTQSVEKSHFDYKMKPPAQLQQKEVKAELCSDGFDREKEDKMIPDEVMSRVERISDIFVTTTVEQRYRDEVPETRDFNKATHVEYLDKEDREFESGEKSGTLFEMESVVKLETHSENKLEGKRELEKEYSENTRSVTAEDQSKIEMTQTDTKSQSEEVPVFNEKGVTIGESKQLNESQRHFMSDDQDPETSEVKSKPCPMECSSTSRENNVTEVTSSPGEYSDGESDISEVSSVHTSDLSSFDEDVSSAGESYEAYDRSRPPQTETSEHGVHEDQLTMHMQSERLSARRRSTRISSRRSTKDGESETSEGEGHKTPTVSSRERPRGDKASRKPRSESGKGSRESGTVKRGRGRPRKDERRATHDSAGQIRRSRARVHDGRDKTGEGRDKTKRSQRTIKRTRCYSPSSEGTREVFLPRKKSRDGPS
ncbi:uncharacterized protein LOC141874800 isoform X2 [Acropora palmata]